MFKRLPIVPTILVVVAAAIMVSLGFWQIGRAQEKDRLKLAMEERPALPVIDYPFADATNEEYLYRRLRADCDAVTGIDVSGGMDAAGRTGWRQIASCTNAATGQVFQVQIGVAKDPGEVSQWQGGPVEGVAKESPDNRSALERMFSGGVRRPAMIVASEPKAGLLPSQAPNPEEYRNSSWAYAGQWFFFAITALVIYGFALRSRAGKRA